MLRIRRICDELIPVNRDALQQVREILRTRFGEVRQEEEELGLPFVVVQEGGYRTRAKDQRPSLFSVWLLLGFI